MRDSVTTVSAELGLMLVVPQHATVPLVASLFYSGDDPYAVRMAFHVGTDEPVEWIFARDLLAAGMTETAGEGDVRVWPSDDNGQPVLNIVLSSPFGQAHFEAPQSAMQEFLGRTFEAIPAGHEGEYFDFGGELDSLLWRA
ncbi:MAG TPA: SsgA family sporulation/cell division regulator [Streptosporangiaceae bacterium]